MKKTAAFLLTLAMCFNIVCFAQTNLSEEYFKLSEAYSAKKYEECIELCDSVLEMDKSYMEAYYFKAMSAFYSQNTELAYTALTEQLRYNPKNRLALYNAACAASLLGKEAECVNLLRRLFELDITEKSAIKQDSDFDNVRNSEGYKHLMEISVLVGGQLVEFDVAPMIAEGVTLLPMRKIFEMLGAEVTYDEATRTAIAVKDDIKIEISQTAALINGEVKEMDVPAMIVEGRTLVPVRFIAESLKAKVEWDAKNEVVDIIMPMPDGNAEYEEIKKILDEHIVVCPIDGMFPEPYQLQGSEGNSLIVFESEVCLDVFAQLSVEDKIKYISSTVYDNYGSLVGCEPVYAKVVYGGEMYYEGEFHYVDNDNITDLKYYSEGKPVNVVKQIKEDMNYKDLYLFP